MRSHPLLGRRPSRRGLRLRRAASLAAALLFAPALAEAGTWTWVASEYATFTVDHPTTVRYGIEPHWITKEASGTVPCINAWFGGDPAVGLGKQCWASSEPPAAAASPWTFAAWENQSFTVTGVQTVRYGNEPDWVTRTVSGTVPCTNTFFGRDPAVGIGKHCERPAGDAGAPDMPPAPSLDLDFTRDLPARVTFARPGARTAIVDGTLRTLPPHQPAIESWDGTPRGLAIEAAATNLLTRSNGFADASWEKGGIASGGLGPDGASAMALQHERAASGGIAYFLKPVGTQAAGTRQTFSAFVRLPAGSTRWAVRLRMANRWDNHGPRAYLRIDGTPGAYTLDNGSATNVSAGLRRLANGIHQVWITGTWVVTGAKEFEIRLLNQDHEGAIDGGWIGRPSEGLEVWGAQATTTAQPVGYIDTAATPVSSTGETATITDLSWLAAAQGTLMVEHDCPSGALLGSGAGTVLSATRRGRAAIAWDAAGSSVAENGAASGVDGATPRFGPTLRLLPGNACRIVRLTAWPTRADRAALRRLTTPPTPGTARPGALRAASVDNRLPSATHTTSGAQLHFASRFRLRLGGAALSALRLDFANFVFGATRVGNPVVIDEVFLERATGIAESVRVRFRGAHAVVLADGAANVLSDAVLPSQFTGLVEFAAGMDFHVRLRGHVNAAGHKLPLSRSTAEAGAQGFVHEGGTLANLAGTGALVPPGGSSTTLVRGVAPILVGTYAAGDPKTLFLAGDSLIEGTGPLTATGTFVRKAAAALGIPVIEFSRGGQAQNGISELGAWKPYLRYCRIYLDAFGTNNVNQTLHFFSLWKAARDAGAGVLAHVGLLPRTASSDAFASEANQSVLRAFPADIDRMLASAHALGFVDVNAVPRSIRGADPAKWLSDGTARFATSDGVHPSVVGDNLMQAELESVLGGIALGGVSGESQR